MKKLNTKQLKNVKALPTKSSKIRYLDRMNYTRSEIVTYFKESENHTIRYQHVRNVLITPIQNERK